VIVRLRVVRYFQGESGAPIGVFLILPRRPVQKPINSGFFVTCGVFLIVIYVSGLVCSSTETLSQERCKRPGFDVPRLFVCVRASVRGVPTL
jgi:hypothetical protein